MVHTSRSPNSDIPLYNTMVKPVYSEHLWATEKWFWYTGGLFMEMRVDGISSSGTLQSGF